MGSASQNSWGHAKEFGTCLVGRGIELEDTRLQVLFASSFVSQSHDLSLTLSWQLMQ